MPKATDYRKRADECIKLAQTARTPAQRTMLLHIADTWLRLAGDVEENERPNGKAEMRPPATTLM
jgi:hypothetical protein